MSSAWGRSIPCANAPAAIPDQERKAKAHAADRVLRTNAQKKHRAILFDDADFCKIARSFELSSRTVPSLSSAPARTDRAQGRTARALLKGQQTHAAILGAALALASQKGLAGLSIGAIAEVLGMSKSGVFAHFGSREELQISVVREYHARFEDEVFTPALDAARGLPRLRELFNRWLRRVSVEIDSGCIYISGAVEFDDQPGPVRDALVGMVQTWQRALERAIRLTIDSGHFRADTDPAEVLFDMHGLILALHHDARFLRAPGAVQRAQAAFERVLTHYAAMPTSATAAKPRKRPA
jgi:AcrR family transcriptional regulator